MPEVKRIIVLAEDDDGHATLIERNLRRGGLPTEIVRLRDGQAVIDAFRGRPGSAGPMALLLDLKMPRLDGLSVLRQLKGDPATAKVPVVILTTTDHAEDVERCYALGAAAYITKPVGSEEFSRVIQSLAAFLSIVHLPRGEIAGA